LLSCYLTVVPNNEWSYSSLLASLPPATKMKATKKKMIALPPMLAYASIRDIVLEEVIDKLSLEAIQVDGKGLMTTKFIFAIDFKMLKVD
jgi:hypothetical protein